MVPYTATSVDYSATFGLNFSSGATAGAIDYSVTETPATFGGSVVLVEGTYETSIPDSGFLDLNPSEATSIIVTPEPQSGGSSETVTLALLSTPYGCCCADYSTGSPSSASVTFDYESPPTPQPTPFCSCTGPLAGTASPITKVMNPEEQSGGRGPIWDRGR